MKTTILLFIAVSLVPSVHAQEFIKATAENGTRYALYPDGTWKPLNVASADTRGGVQMGSVSAPRLNVNPHQRSQEGVPEHTYEFIVDYTLMIGSGKESIRFKRGDRYHGRILASHAEVDVNNVSYSIPRSALNMKPLD